uniref:Syntaxin 6 n=1 Tax=Eptatretus burgeri TaxID=7764 RepID=A0A8C4Q605_EPTBU
MSFEDPFYSVKGEVQNALQLAQQQCACWRELVMTRGNIRSLANRVEVESVSNELRNALRSIEWDLEDLEETIGVVEANPQKFRINAAQMTQRKAFTTQVRQEVKAMKDELSSPEVTAVIERNTRQALTDGTIRISEKMENPEHSRFIEDQQTQQELIIDQQDNTLEMVSGSIGVLKHMSTQIGEELDEQAVMLDEFSHEMESTQSRLDTTLRKMAKLSHMTNDRRQWCAIGVLLVIMVVLLILFLAL